MRRSRRECDIDSAILPGIDRKKITFALTSLGFTLDGRSYVNPTTAFSIDIVADTPYIDRRPLHDFQQVETPHGPVTVVKLQDAIADRIAAFLYWEDSQSLDVAERALRATRDPVMWSDIEWSLHQLDHSGPRFEARFQMAVERLKRSYDER